MLRARNIFVRRLSSKEAQRPFKQKANWREMNYPHRKERIFQLKYSWKIWVEVRHERGRKAEMLESEKDCSPKRITLPKELGYAAELQQKEMQREREAFF